MVFFLIFLTCLYVGFTFNFTRLLLFNRPFYPFRSHKVSCNGLGLAEGGVLALKFNRRTEVEPCINAQSKNFSPAFGKPLLVAGLPTIFLLCLSPNFLFCQLFFSHSKFCLRFRMALECQTL